MQTLSTQHKTNTPYGSGKSIDLNGNHYVVVSTTGEDTFDGGNQFTITLWTKEFPENSWAPFVAKRGESSQGWQLRRYGGDQKVSFTLRGPGGDDSLRPSINLASWTHLAGVWGGGKVKIFADGVLVASEDRTGAVNITNSALVFGAKDNSGNYNSSSPNIGSYSNLWLDDIRFYNVFLSDSEISSIYGGGLGDVGQPWIKITSPSTATAATGMAFTYQITATNSPTNFSLADAPSWMSVNAATGVVSGYTHCRWSGDFQGRSLQCQRDRLSGSQCHCRRQRTLRIFPSADNRSHRHVPLRHHRGSFHQFECPLAHLIRAGKSLRSRQWKRR